MGEQDVPGMAGTCTGSGAYAAKVAKGDAWAMMLLIVKASKIAYTTVSRGFMAPESRDGCENSGSGQRMLSRGRTKGGRGQHASPTPPPAAIKKRQTRDILLER